MRIEDFVRHGIGPGASDVHRHAVMKCFHSIPMTGVHSQTEWWREAAMAIPVRRATAILALVIAAAGLANAKKKVYLPSFVLKAQTVMVVILPNTGEPLSDPNANRNAQENVEKAFLKWGRYQVVHDASQADILVGVRKGTGKIANPTISGGPIDSRPATVETTDNDIHVSVQQGHPPDVSQPTPPTPPGMGAPSAEPHTGVDVGPRDDTLSVFQGRRDYPLDSPAVWRCTVKDGLSAPDVIAVEQFRKAVEESDKAAAQLQQQQQSQKKNP